MSKPKKILIAPLGWGLGHATRCIPIIRELQKQGANILLASDGRALLLLKQEFPQLPSFELPSYDVTYSSKNMVWNIGMQFPKILQAIWLEHRTVRQLANREDIDGIISDNRFGCFMGDRKCVFITHQVNIQLPFFLLNKIANYFNHLIINKFQACWIPDTEAEPNLAGLLSHNPPYFLMKKTRYIGALSRMEKSDSIIEQRYDAIAVLSGPEPQRTELEQAIIAQAAQIPEIHFLIVQGKPEAQQNVASFQSKNIEMIASMTGKELNQAIYSSGIFIGRSGYSTVMDLAKLGKQAILIPTPGQTEQEYLAKKLQTENQIFTQQQQELNLREGLAAASNHTGFRGDFFDEKALTEAVKEFLETF